MISEPRETTGNAVVQPAGVAPARQAPLKVLLAWSVVALPAAWGIYMTVLTSVQLFRPTPVTHVPSPTAEKMQAPSVPAK